MSVAEERLLCSNQQKWKQKPVLSLEQALLSATSNASTPAQVQFLLDIGILAVSALVLSVIFARLKITIVSGQILAGMIVGPHVLGWVSYPRLKIVGFTITAGLAVVEPLCF